ncbi:hypothetical protein IA539_00560 [Gordonia sp. zg691]|uniref:Uncharacterized protein n=2 Tax=Gordonia jinghuaiqii TaxID=2758710 RepID=A0A7D7R0M1_9ACTN|nr:hypothetical protein [Gordonia jinghuaiqii]MBD0859709.1 hypothetical protein [Gordonia jinghuaiqii]MCR5976933.1 hypothetical protein [Gordonia jinghuaiqii]QMT03968.1 hypothetical protein H1R19_16240 [Gordonia jinghuaiqii]
MVVGMVTAAFGAGTAVAVPAEPEPNYVTTLVCDSANPWPAGPIKVRVDVLNQIRFPADGLPGPAIALIGTDRAKRVALEYTYDVAVSWRNLRTGRTGVTKVPGRGFTVKWQVDLHPGSGPVVFTIRQKIGALAFSPMVNPQYSTCRGRAVA